MQLSRHHLLFCRELLGAGKIFDGRLRSLKEEGLAQEGIDIGGI